MLSVNSGSMPASSLLQIYANQEGCYTDCFFTDVSKRVLLEEMIVTFFTTSVFRLERKLLGLFASKPSTDIDVRNLATGASDALAAWKVEAREESQLIMTAANGHVRTWLMVEPLAKDQNQTRLYFGSAVLPKKNIKTGEYKGDLLFCSLIGFHKFYSRILLGLARKRLQ